MLFVIFDRVFHITFCVMGIIIFPSSYIFVLFFYYSEIVIGNQYFVVRLPKRWRSLVRLALGSNP